MKLFLDENVQQPLVGHLQSIFPTHRFVGVSDLSTKGADDVTLFPIVAAAGCDVFVTGDRQQLHRVDERDACRIAGLHWIGIHQVNKVGYHSLAGPASTLIHALPFIFDALRNGVDEPRYFQLKKSERNDTKVFAHSGNL